MNASVFTFERFEVDVASGSITFHYHTDANHVFLHEVTLDIPENTNPSDIAAAAFTLGMATLIHYWKAVLTPTIRIEAGDLSSEQVAFWKNLYLKGLGEFFYVNNIDPTELMHIEVSDSAPTHPLSKSVVREQALVPFGGGKDSLVTGEILQEKGRPFTWFELEPLPHSKELLVVTPTQKSVYIGRDVSKNFAEVKVLVEKGAPTGHVPITATYMCAATIAALVYGYKDIVLSLERSAEEGNTTYLGNTINHQYSKTFEFEKEMALYVKKYIHPEVRLFSLLRPWYELQIMERFVTYPKYFSKFISCNKGLQTKVWCRKCAKCAFTFLALSAFLPPKEVQKIFSANLFEDVELVPLYSALLGYSGIKPLDCVGTIEENRLALYLAHTQYVKAKEQLPALFSHIDPQQGEHYRSLLEEEGPANIPSEYV